MKTASILLAVVVVLGFVSEAGAQNRRYMVRRTEEVAFKHDCRITVAGQLFGFADGETWTIPPRPFSRIYLGPLGHYQIPFTATQGLIGFGLILALLIIVPVVLTVRRKKKRVSLWG